MTTNGSCAASAAAIDVRSSARSGGTRVVSSAVRRFPLPQSAFEREPVPRLPLPQSALARTSRRWPPLLINLGILAPEHLVLVTPAVYEAAYEPLTQAGFPVVDVRVPEPSHALEFRQRLRRALVRADLEKLIRPRPSPRAPEQAS